MLLLTDGEMIALGKTLCFTVPRRGGCIIMPLWGIIKIRRQKEP